MPLNVGVIEMVVGLLTGELLIHESNSLKEKRSVLQKVFSQLKKNLNVSVAEVEHQDLWQRSVIAVACVNTEARDANATLNQALAIIDSFHELEFMNQSMEMR